jgi:hypothetical protein
MELGRYKEPTDAPLENKYKWKEDSILKTRRRSFLVFCIALMIAEERKGSFFAILTERRSS